MKKQFFFFKSKMFLGVFFHSVVVLLVLVSIFHGTSGSGSASGASTISWTRSRIAISVLSVISWIILVSGSGSWTASGTRSIFRWRRSASAPGFGSTSFVAATSGPWPTSGSWSRTAASTSWASGTRPSPGLGLFNQFNSPSVEFSSVQFIKGSFHIPFRSKFHASFVPPWLVCISVSHLTSLTHVILQILF